LDAKESEKFILENKICFFQDGKSERHGRERIQKSRTNRAFIISERLPVCVPSIWITRRVTTKVDKKSRIVIFTGSYCDRKSLEGLCFCWVRAGLRLLVPVVEGRAGPDVGSGPVNCQNYHRDYPDLNQSSNVRKKSPIQLDRKFHCFPNQLALLWGRYGGRTAGVLVTPRRRPMRQETRDKFYSMQSNIQENVLTTLFLQK
jgi:hypothetical protein